MAQIRMLPRNDISSFGVYYMTELPHNEKVISASHHGLDINLVFKTHLDIGFTNFAKDVVAGYFDRYFHFCSGMVLAWLKNLTGDSERKRLHQK